MLPHPRSSTWCNCWNSVQSFGRYATVLTATFTSTSERGKIGQLSKNCINGLSVDLSQRKNHTLSYLLAAPGELEETGNLVSDGARKMMAKEKNDGKSSEENKKSIASGL